MSGTFNEYYQIFGLLGACKGYFNGKLSEWKEKHPDGLYNTIKNKFFRNNYAYDPENYTHLYRKKTGRELIRLSAAVMGIEFAYAAETAFVTPTLLKIGVEHKHMTLVWALSPFLGFILTPILGSLSDRCSLSLGRRRPFILLLSLGVIIGLILVPNGEDIGYSLGDTTKMNNTSAKTSSFRTSTKIRDESYDNELNHGYRQQEKAQHPWGIFFTILGTILLDFDADACQSPSRAYLLDVLIPDDHAKGLSTFTVMAGLGGSFGYALGAIDWNNTTIGVALGGHVRAVFTLITILFVCCVLTTVTSFDELPLYFLESAYKEPTRESVPEETQIEGCININMENYGTINEDNEEKENLDATINEETDAIELPSLSTYIKSIFNLPWSLTMLCITNFFNWIAHVCYSLYFTDYVAESVFKGDPTADEGTEGRILYDAGVQHGCWGMSMYSLSCACYSLIIEKCVKRFGAKKIFVGGPIFYASGMFLMAILQSKVAVVILSGAAGIMYSTLFTMPYILVANYHAKGVFGLNEDGQPKQESQVRGLGTDVAIVSSMVFLAQFMLSFWMGTIVNLTGTTTSVVVVAGILALAGSYCATKVVYLDL